MKKVIVTVSVRKTLWKARRRALDSADKLTPEEALEEIREALAPLHGRFDDDPDDYTTLADTLENIEDILSRVQRREAHTDLEQRVREAHKACPCRENAGVDSCSRPGWCACVKPVRPHSENKTWLPCAWKGHAAIDALAEQEEAIKG